ncbi:MAG: lipoprotein signal peptidase [Comamonadaceae bacterium]|nr:MAG: lipoprotein signal peptidase [Comamonadaceae bacterium]
MNGPVSTTARTAPQGRSLLFWLMLAVAIVIIDQVTKVYFNTQYQYGERHNVLPFFDLTLMYNRGAAFSFLADEGGWQRWFFTALGIGASVVIVWLLRKHAANTRFSLALTLIMGGAIGNVIDRAVYGHVVDFLLFYWKDWYYPAFNVADMGIVCGAILLVLDEFLKSRKPASR